MAEQVIAVEDILSEIARPELYRLNGFRITELPVDAEARDISRRQATIKQALDINVSVPPGYGRVLPLKQGTDPDALSEAIQHLGDPERRLVDELFWFWPRQLGKSRWDDALLAMSRGEVASAHASWQQLRDQPEDEGSSLHNLAVLCHTLALDWEHTALTSKLSIAEQQERTILWKEAFSAWKQLLESEAFWSQVTARIRELDDPRLTTGMVRRIRTLLPLTLLSINARLAVSAAERNNAAECQRQLGLLKSSEFEQEAVDEALHNAVEPIRERIKTLCRMIETQAPLDPEKADEVARTFLDQSEPILKLLDTLLPEGDATRDGMHDEIVRYALTAVILYGNKTSNWSIFLPLTTRLEALAVSELLRERVKENSSVAREGLEAQLCWYCAARPSQKGAERNVKMYGNVVRTYYYRQRRVQWQNITIAVRRCNECQLLHEKAKTYRAMGIFLGILLAIGLTVLVIMGLISTVPPATSYDINGNQTTSPGDPSGAICGGIFIGAVILWFCIWLGMVIGQAIDKKVFLDPQHVREEKDVKFFPGVDHWLQRGWKIGARPAR